MYLFDYYVYNINKKRNFTKMFNPPPLKKFLDLQVINILHVTENFSYIHRSLCKNITSNANDDLWRIFVLCTWRKWEHQVHSFSSFPNCLIKFKIIFKIANFVDMHLHLYLIFMLIIYCLKKILVCFVFGSKFEKWRNLVLNRVIFLITSLAML